jgi:hypothetical protein
MTYRSASAIGKLDPNEMSIGKNTINDLIIVATIQGASATCTSTSDIYGLVTNIDWGYSHLDGDRAQEDNSSIIGISGCGRHNSP